jgi:hypothetical protein
MRRSVLCSAELLEKSGSLRTQIAPSVLGFPSFPFLAVHYIAGKVKFRKERKEKEKKGKERKLIKL